MTVFLTEEAFGEQDAHESVRQGAARILDMDVVVRQDQEPGAQHSVPRILELARRGDRVFARYLEQVRCDLRQIGEAADAHVADRRQLLPYQFRESESLQVGEGGRSAVTLAYELDDDSVNGALARAGRPLDIE